MRRNTKKLFSNFTSFFRRLQKSRDRGARISSLAYIRGFGLGLALVVIAVSLVLLSFPETARSGLINEELGATFGLGTTSLLDTVIRVVQWFLGFLALIAVIIIMYGGFLWMTAAGNEERVARAKKTITRAVIGLIIILLAWAIVIFVVRFVTNATDGNLPPHCSNNVQDADEEGEDCGGSECPACSGGPVDANRFVITAFQDSNGSGDPRFDVHLCSKVKSLYNRGVNKDTVDAAVIAGTIEVVQDPGPGEAEVLGTWTTASKSVTFDPTSLLNPDKQFQVRIPKSLKSLGLPPLDLFGCSGLGVPGCVDGDPITWRFNTGVDNDSTRPTITSTYPTFDTPDPLDQYPNRNVSMLPVIEVNFSEPIDDTSIVDPLGQYPRADRFWLQELEGPSGDVVGPYTADYAADLTIDTTETGFRVHLNSAKPLKAFTWYRISVRQIEDLCGNVMDPSELVWEFQTNDRSPGIGSVYPEGTNQCPDTRILVTFNTTMYYNTVQIVVDGPGNNPHLLGSLKVDTNDVSAVNATIQVNDPGNPVDNNYRTYELVPTVPLPLNTNFTAQVTTDMVIDTDGNLLERSWTFSTSDNQKCACKPLITSIKPEQGLNGQCVTINGACFTGTPAHSAFPSSIVFQKDGNDYPAVPGGFTAKQITTSVPSGFVYDPQLPPPTLTPQVTIDYGQEFGSIQTTNSTEKFVINEAGESKGPCLFSISPDTAVQGQPNMMLRGTRFNPDSPTKQAIFEGAPPNNIPGWSDTAAVTDVPATATEKTCNQVFVRNSVGDSNPVCLDVVPPGFRVVDTKPPFCTDVCRNALMGFGVTEPLETTTLSASTAKVLRCIDSKCLDTEVVDLGLTPFYDAPTLQVSFANPGLDQNTWYKIVVVGGSSGLKNTSGGELESTNTTFAGSPAFAWKFKTRDNPEDCAIESLSLAPSTKTVSVGTTQGYVASPTASTQCNEVLDPSTFSWSWSTANPVPNPPDETQLQPPGSTCSGGARNGLGCAQAADCPDGACVGMNLRSVLATGPTAPNFSTIRASADTENATAQLTITDCNTDAHCQTGCGIPGNQSMCNTATKKCTPWIEAIDAGLPQPPSGPKGSYFTVDGCYFGSTPGQLTVGGTQAIMNVCPAGWTNTRIVAGIPDVAKDVSHPVRVTTSAGEVSNPNKTYTVTDLCPGGAPVPDGGRPGICDLAPDSGTPGTGVRINGSAVGLTGLTRAVEFFSSAGNIQVTDADLLAPGIWNNNLIDKIKVPSGAETGPVKVVVENCPSNTLEFGISCGSSADCSAGQCCKSGSCVDAALCSNGEVEALCQIAENPATANEPPDFKENPNCASGPASAPEGHDCISTTGDSSSVVPPPPGPGYGDDCRFCCVPGQVYKGLTCVENQGLCTGGSRGLYCGCTDNAQCGAGLACGDPVNDPAQCCHTRPSLDERYPDPADPPLPCTNAYLGGTFSEEMLGSSLNDTTIRLYEGAVVVPSKISRVGATGFRISPTSALSPGVTYRIEVKGGANGVKSRYGIPLDADVTWTFTVADDADLCKIAKVRVEISSSDPAALQERTDDLFTCEGNPTDTENAKLVAGNYHCIGDQDTTSVNGNQHYVHGVPVDASDTLLDPDDFTWTFEESGPDIVALSNITTDNERYATNSPTNGLENVRIAAVSKPDQSLGSASSTARFRTFICKNPWPAGTAAQPFPFTDQASPPHKNWATSSLPGNFSFFYCRDRGDPDDTSDDLPALRMGVGQPNVKANLNLYAGNDVTKDELVKQFLFFSNETVEESESNAIGLRMMENYGYDGNLNHGLSIRDWYTRNAPAPQGSPSDLTIDGYGGLRDGRTVYVAATNYTDDIALGNIYGTDLIHMVYLLSYAQNATPDTIEIFNRLLENWEFNTNVDPSAKPQIQRDIKRIQDIETIETALIEKKSEVGSYPILQGGTFINGQSTSKWPSWQETLGAALGIDMPRDPLNEFNGCPAGFEAESCWREEQKQFRCQADSHIYHYDVDPNGQGVRLYANLEDPLSQWATADDNTLFDCSAAGGSQCTCYNYQNDGKGNPSDRIPPELDVEIDGNPPPFPPLQGTEVNSGAQDPGGSGVAKVEFYIDGILQFTDTDSADGWKWIMDSRRYGDGAHELTVIAFDVAGNRSIPFKSSFPSSSDGQYDITVGNGCPGCGPDVFISIPLDGATEGGLMEFKTVSTDDGQVVSVNLRIQGGDVDETRTCNIAGKSVNCDWPGGGFDTTTIPNGQYTLTGIATDNAGLVGQASISVNIDNTDTENPTIQITTPVDANNDDVADSPVGGNANGQYTVTVNAIANDNVGVVRVDFYINGILRFTDATSPYEFVWDTTKTPNGQATITAIAYDAVGRTGSDQLVVTVDNPDRPPGACAPTECASGDKSLCGPDGCCPQDTCFASTGQVCRNGQWITACGEGTCQQGECNEQFTCPEDCGGLPYCGNNIAEPEIEEVCDDKPGPGGDLAGRTCPDLNGDGQPDPGGYYCGTLGCVMDQDNVNRCKQFDTANCVTGFCGNGTLECGEECDVNQMSSCNTANSPFGTCSAAPTCPTGPGGCDCKYQLDCSACAVSTPDYCTNCAKVTGICTGCENNIPCVNAGVPGTCQAGLCLTPCQQGEQRCFNNTSQVCNGGQWINEALTTPDSKPAIPGDQFEGQCTGKICYNNADVTCGVNNGDAVCTIAAGAPLACSLNCSFFWPGVYCSRCGTAVTCNDGAQNCGETGVDTGGSCGAACAPDQCRNSSGQCTNQSNSACGRDGFQCVSCGANQFCDTASGTCLNAVCPNNKIEGNEVCDGTDLAGRTCVTQGFESGTLACKADCTQFDLSGCSCAADQCRPNGTGACTDQSDTQCGRNGTACVACPAGQTCNTGTGTCEPAGCPVDQCRNSSGQCTVQSNTACGRNGNTCVACPVGQTCNTTTGTCELAACQPNQCRDQSSLQCVNSGDTACGFFSASCINCASTGQVCVNGTCMNPCAAGQCRDTNGVCQGSDNDSCGLNGVVCTNCAAQGQTCFNGNCIAPCAADQCRDTVTGQCRNQSNTSCGRDGGGCVNCTQNPGNACDTVLGACTACGATQCRNVLGQCTNSSTTSCGSNGTSCIDCTTQPAPVCKQSAGVSCSSGLCSFPNSPAGTSCDASPTDCVQSTCNGSGTCNSANLPDGTVCTAAGPQSGYCSVGVCYGYLYLVELSWDSSVPGTPNDLDLYLFAENQGVIYKGNPSGVGLKFMGDKQSNGQPVKEQILIQTTLQNIQYDVYVKNNSGGSWTGSPTVQFKSQSAILGTFNPDASNVCWSLPWWQSFRVSFNSGNPNPRILGARMMKDGVAVCSGFASAATCSAQSNCTWNTSTSSCVSDGVTLSATTANMVRMGMPYRAGYNYCCSGNGQCGSPVAPACQVNNKCNSICGDGQCTTGEDPGTCAVDCGPNTPAGWCDYYCKGTYGADFIQSFCQDPASCLFNPLSGTYECNEADNNHCPGTQECCCVVSSSAGSCQ